MNGITAPARGGGERGSVMITFVLVAMPLLLLVGSASLTMTARSTELDNAIAADRALLAVESGLDQARFVSNTTGLTSGVPITRTLGPDHSFVVEPLNLMTDGVDNDGDTLVDEPDENVFQLTITGTYGRVRKRVAAYLGPTPGLPPIEGAVMSHFPGMELDLDTGSPPYVRGDDKNMNGTPGPRPPLPGIVIAPPGTTGNLSSMLLGPSSAVQGGTPSPSFGVASAALDVAGLVARLAAAADTVLTAEEYAGTYTFGNASTGDYRIVYRNGNLRFRVNVRGAGILVVNGPEFRTEDNFHWDGLIIVRGSDRLRSEDSFQVNGAVIAGPTLSQLRLEDNSRIQYSSEAIAAISNLLPGKFIVLSGWQELPN